MWQEAAKIGHCLERQMVRSRTRSFAVWKGLWFLRGKIAQPSIRWPGAVVKSGTNWSLLVSCLFLRWFCRHRLSVASSCSHRLLGCRLMRYELLLS